MTRPHAEPPPFNPRVPFGRAEARAAGITDKALRRPAYQRIFYDTYPCSSVAVTTTVRVAASIKRTGSTTAYASHHTATELWGIPVPVDGLIHITDAKGEGRNRSRGIITHQPLIRGDKTRVRCGVRVSVPVQVFGELAAAGVGLVDLVVAGDAMLRATLATHESPQRAVDGMGGSGVRRARRALGYVRAGVDSAMESRLRMLLVLAGFPEPQVNFILCGFDGNGNAGSISAFSR